MVRLSIIIPCLNEGGVIGRLLERLQPLRQQGYEVILVDGGSSDGTRSIARPLVDRLLQTPPGRARQMNAAAREASGEWLWFLHADSDVDAETLLGLPEQIAMGGRLWGRFDVSLDGGHRLLPLVALFMNWRSRLSGIATGDQGIFVQRRLFDAIGGYPEIALMEDIALSRILRAEGRPLCLRQRLRTSARRWERHGVLRTVFLMWRLRLLYFLGADPQRLARRYRLCSSPARES